MEGMGDLRSREIHTRGKTYTISIEEEDLSRLYPGMIRYTLRLVSDGVTLGLFRTNTYEYSPTVPLDAVGVISRRAAEW